LPVAAGRQRAVAYAQLAHGNLNPRLVDESAQRAVGQSDADCQMQHGKDQHDPNAGVGFATDKSADCG
jgi:hypothetical protein